MPETPAEYTDCVTKLKLLRKAILAELVSGRVKATLDAGHDSMQKYKGVIEQLSIVPTLFSRVKDRALALKLGKASVGEGNIYQLGAEYVLGKVPYPLTPPFSVSQRNLPQVDVFRYELIDNLKLLDKTNMASLQSFIILQCNSGTFEETPEAENAVYDYYTFYPQARYRSEWDLTNLEYGFQNVETLKGEHIDLVRKLTKKGTTDQYDYWIKIWLEGNLYTGTDLFMSPKVAAQCETDPIAPAAHYCIVGQRISYTDTALYAAGMEKAGTVTFLAKICGTITPISSVAVWYNHFDVTMEVNETYMGYTDPAVGVHTLKAGELHFFYAYANTGYVFDYWMLDGVNIGGDSTIHIQIFKDCTLRAVFKTV